MTFRLWRCFIQTYQFDIFVLHTSSLSFIQVFSTPVFFYLVRYSARASSHLIVEITTESRGSSTMLCRSINCSADKMEVKMSVLLCCIFLSSFHICIKFVQKVWQRRKRQQPSGVESPELHRAISYGPRAPLFSLWQIIFSLRQIISLLGQIIFHSDK